jgi:hypothetical protein
MFMNIKSTGYGEDTCTGWKARYRLSTLNFGPHKRSLNTNTVSSPYYLVHRGDPGSGTARTLQAFSRLPSFIFFTTSLQCSLSPNFIFFADSALYRQSATAYFFKKISLHNLQIILVSLDSDG